MLGSYVKVVSLNPKLYKEIQHFGRLQGSGPHSAIGS